MVKVKLNGVIVKEAERVEAGDIKEIARLNGVARFVVKDETGRLLTPSDFPLTGEREVVIEPYNEAG